MANRAALSAPSMAMQPTGIPRGICTVDSRLSSPSMVEDFTGTRHGFVRFRPEVVQFFHDDISDYNGNWSGLAQDIAGEIFDQELLGIHFCTADKRECGAQTGKE